MFYLKFHIYLNLLSAPVGLKTFSNLKCNTSVQFQKKKRHQPSWLLSSLKHAELGHFTMLFCRRRLQNVQRLKRTCTAIVLDPVVRKVDCAIHRINHFPVDSMACFVDTYPLDSDLSGGQRYPAFEQPGPADPRSDQSSIINLIFQI